MQMLRHQMRLIAGREPAQPPIPSPVCWGRLGWGEQAVKRAVIALLAAGIVARVCNIGIYPPIGGISVYMWGLGAAVFLAAACWAAACIDARRVSALYERLAPVAPIIGVSCLLALWAAAVYLFTDTLSLLRLGHFVMGIGLIFAVWFAADSARKAKLLLGVVVACAAASALYGVAVAAFGDPFMTVWIILGKVGLGDISNIIAGGRMAGLSTKIIALSYILAAAAPLTFALLVVGPTVIPAKAGIHPRTPTRDAPTNRHSRPPFRHSREGGNPSPTIHSPLSTISLHAALYLALALMLSVLLLNATRSAILGGFGGCVIVGAILLIGRPDLWKRMAVVIALTAVWLLLMFVPGVRGAEAILGSGPQPAAVTEAAAPEPGIEDAWFGRALVRVSQPGWPSDRDSPYETALRERLEAARELWRDARADFGLSGRIVSVGDTSARARIPMTLTALRYSLEHPLGTGTYAPEPRHLPGGLSPHVAEEVLKHTPHNQFLVVLVYYGYPGLLLLAAFYLLIARSLLTTARHFLRSRDTESLLLAAAVTGALAGYGLNSLFHNAGPFVGDWFHFIIVGLVFCIERNAAAKPLPQPHTL